jgi:glycosyltransferase involved in cell wall biosynthesis
VSEKRRVGIVIGQLSFGGAERQTALLARGLASQSPYVPAVFCLSNQVSPFGHELTEAGVECLYPGRNPAPGSRKLAWLAGQLRHRACDLLYGILNPGNVYAGLGAAAVSAPLICSARSSAPDLSAPLRWLSGVFCRRADWVISNSKASQQAVRTYLGVTHDRVSVIPNGVEVSTPNANARSSIRRDLGVGPEDLLVGSIASLRRPKRPEFFTRVFLELQVMLERAVHFAWVGSNGMRQQAAVTLVASVPKARRANLHFIPSTTRVSDFLAAFDAFVLTSSYEGMPNALLEAMAAGLPCVATDVEGTRDALDVAGASGRDACVLANKDEPVRFATALAQLARDSRRMAELGERAAGFVREYFTVEKMIQHHIDVFDRVLRSRGKLA